jgi:hypothetical protein
VYFRLMFGGELDQAFAEQVVDAVLRGYAAAGKAGGTATAHGRRDAVASGRGASPPIKGN